MRRLHPVMLAAAIAGAVGLASSAAAAPFPPAGARTVTDPVATDVAYGCGPGYTRGHFGACVTLHHRHHRMHGRYSGHDYDIHDHTHYHEDPHLYHGPRHHRRHHRH